MLDSRATCSAALFKVIPAAGVKETAGFKKFASEKEFKEYLAKAAQAVGGYYGRGGGIMTLRAAEGVTTQGLAAPTAAPAPGGIAEKSGVAPVDMDQSAGRISETNVQVAGIDEPDILKTDGKEIYYSSNRGRQIMFKEPVQVLDGGTVGAGKVVPGFMPPQYNYVYETQLIKAFPPEKLAKDGTIDQNGNLLLVGTNLVVFSNNGNAIYGYDVSNAAAPKEKWNIKMDSRSQIDQARLRGGKIYVVSKTGVNRSHPCPMPLYEIGDKKVSIACTDVYRPGKVVSADVTYNVSEINPATGEIKPGISFVGSYNSTIYMSPDYLYAGYVREGDPVDLMYGFFKENVDLFSQNMVDDLAKLSQYDISNQAKMVELERIMNDFENSLSEDEALKVQNEMQNRGKTYFEKHKRELQTTEIVKIGIDSFNIKATGAVPGHLLNQFSLDEYKDNLRTAVTIGGSSMMWQFGGNSQDENDVYVLGSDLRIRGSVQGLGKTERIYSARFIDDKGYLVTFRQTDPFYVLDLSDPKNPEMKGELKIPGYSAYLHPLATNRILGVGKEGSNVKISLFDVESAKDPKEADKYVLDEYWTDVANTHHAFLQDAKHKVFFMPGNKGGYIFSYADDKIKMVKAVSIPNARRGAFLDDYFYIVSDEKIVVLNENTWETVKEMSF